MTSTVAPSWAIRVWVDGTHLYVEVPAKTGPALVLKYSKTEGGLSKALEFANHRWVEEQPVHKGTPYVAPASPNVTRIAARSMELGSAQGFTKEQRQAAHKTLKELGLL